MHTPRDSSLLKNTYVFKAGNRSCCKAIAIDVVTPAEAFHRDSCEEEGILFRKLLMSHKSCITKDLFQLFTCHYLL